MEQKPDKTLHIMVATILFLQLVMAVVQVTAFLQVRSAVKQATDDPYGEAMLDLYNKQ